MKAQTTAAEPILSDAQMASYHEERLSGAPRRAVGAGARGAAGSRRRAGRGATSAWRRGAHRCHTRRDLLGGSIHGGCAPSGARGSIRAACRRESCICSRRGFTGSPSRKAKAPWTGIKTTLSLPLTNYDLLAVTFLLDDTTVQNGALQAIPGSHERGPLNHHDADGEFCRALHDMPTITHRTLPTPTYTIW